MERQEQASRIKLEAQQLSQEKQRIQEMALKLKQMKCVEQKTSKVKQAYSREEKKKRNDIITSIKNKEEKLKQEEDRIQVLQQAISVMEAEESELVTNMVKTPETSKHSSSHMTKRLQNLSGLEFKPRPNNSFKPHLYGLEGRPLTSENHLKSAKDLKACKSVDPMTFLDMASEYKESNKT